MKNNTELQIRLKIATQDILMGINQQFQNMQDDLELIIKREFEKFDFERVVREQVQHHIKEVISTTVRDYVRYGEGKDLIKGSIEKLLKDSIAKVVQGAVKEELSL